MDLRPATPADADGIAAVARDSWHAAYDDFLSPETIEATVDAWYDPENLREGVTSGRCYVACDEGAVVAFAHASADVDRTALTGVPELLRLYARESHWGLGIGSALLAQVADDFQGAGHDRLCAVVFEKNEVGRAFYRAREFEIVDRRTELFDGAERAELVVVAPLAELADTDGRNPTDVDGD